MRQNHNLVCTLRVAVAALLFLWAAPAGAHLQAASPSEGLSYLPEYVNTVLHVDVQRALRSPLFARLLALPGFQQEFERATRTLGVDPRHDVSELLAGGKAGQGPPVVLLRGPSLREKAMAFLERQPGMTSQSEIYRGLEILSINGPQAGPASAVAFFDSGLVGLGERDGLKAVVDVRTGAAPSALNNGRLVGLIGHINPSDTFWMATTQPIQSMPPLPLKELQALPVNPSKLQQVVLSGNLDFALAGKVHGIFEDADSAKSLAGLLQGFLALARLRGNQTPAEARALLEGLSVEEQPARVVLSINIPYTAVDEVLAKGRQTHTVR